MNGSAAMTDRPMVRARGVQAMAMRKRDEDEVFPNAAGIDVGGSSYWVAVPRSSTEEPVRECGAMTDDLNALADWLLSCGVDTVALESTGVYCRCPRCSSSVG